jgi:hypothetical protein
LGGGGWVFVVVGGVMGFCAFHFDKTFCADGFPTTSCTVYIWWVKLLSTLSIQAEFGGKGFGGGYEETDGTFYCATIDDYFEWFALCGD